MALLSIRTIPDPILRLKAEPVDGVDDDLRELLSNMAETMYANDGIGLAAPQVGRSVRAIVVDARDKEERGDPEGLLSLVNPVIVEAEGTVLFEEGCLSVPELRADVKRHERILVKAIDAEGEPVEIQAEDLLAIVLQHEMDHLDGTLFIDHIGRLKRELYLRKLRKEASKNA